MVVYGLCAGSGKWILSGVSLGSASSAADEDTASYFLGSSGFTVGVGLPARMAGSCTCLRRKYLSEPAIFFPSSAYPTRNCARQVGQRPRGGCADRAMHKVAKKPLRIKPVHDPLLRINDDCVWCWSVPDRAFSRSHRPCLAQVARMDSWKLVVRRKLSDGVGHPRTVEPAG